MQPSNTLKEKFFKYRVALPPGWSLSTFCEHSAGKLEALGYEAKVVRVDFVVIRIRKKSNQWTQGYVKKHEKWVDFVGPEAMQIGEFLTNGEIPHD